MNTPHKHCHRCGTPYEKLDWPRRCKVCRSEEYRRINPVAVLLQPVVNQYGLVSMVVGRRGIKPFIGEWALIGGHVEFGEDMEAAALREFHEETGIAADQNIQFMHTRGLSDGALLAFFTTNPLPIEALAGFKPCRECTDVMAVAADHPLCFPTHQEALSLWFAKRNS